MAPKKSQNTSTENERSPISSFKMKRQYQFILGSLFVLLALAMGVAFISYFVNGHVDQSVANAFIDREKEAQNWMGKSGAWMAETLIPNGFGVASFLLVKLLFVTGAFMALDQKKGRDLNS